MVFKKVRRKDAHVFDVGCSILHDLASNFLFNSYYVPIYIFLLYSSKPTHWQAFPNILIFWFLYTLSPHVSLVYFFINACNGWEDITRKENYIAFVLCHLMRGQFQFHSSPVPFSFFPHASLGLLNTSPLWWLGSLKSENADWIEVPKGKGGGWRQKWTGGRPQTGVLTQWCPAERSRATTSWDSDCTVGGNSQALCHCLVQPLSLHPQKRVTE